MMRDRKKGPAALSNLPNPLSNIAGVSRSGGKNCLTSVILSTRRPYGHKNNFYVYTVSSILQGCYK